MEKLIIDRFEGNYAICEKEDKSFVNIPSSSLPDVCKEGDCLIKNDDGTYECDKSSTSQRIKKIQNKMNHLFE